MKKFLALFLIGFASLAMASSNGEHFVKNGEQLGGIIGQNVIFIYDDAEAAKVNDKNKLKIMSKITEKRICSDKKMREVIDLGLQVLFIYPTKDNKEVTIISVNSCKKGE